MKGNVRQTVAENRRDFIKFLFLGGILLFLLIIGIRFLPWILSLKDESGRAAFQAYIASKGIGGVLLLLGLQILQVVVAIIPGEVIEVVAGLLYGTFGGFVLCEVGVLIGTAIIYYTVKALGASFLHTLIPEEKLERFRFLREEKRLETVTFLLFFIPGTPKDLLTYFMPLTKIRSHTFFLIVCIARIPSILSSTFAGASIGQGKWVQTLLIFVFIGAIGLFGIWCNSRYLRKKENEYGEDHHG